ncbi:hypothetical protein BSKO_08696 [Bryopsis sp. KO-2023]|nr:hypothetical protein BSKO_08696 [Bryopsis sp. KO-2023]
MPPNTNPGDNLGEDNNLFPQGRSFSNLTSCSEISPSGRLGVENRAFPSLFFFLFVRRIASRRLGAIILGSICLTSPTWRWSCSEGARPITSCNREISTVCGCAGKSILAHYQHRNNARLKASSPLQEIVNRVGAQGKRGMVKFDVHVKSWRAVASWTWNAGDDVCGICRTPFDGCAPEAKFPGDDSSVASGKCGHTYHLECIHKWQGTLNGEAKCPMCRRPWEYKEYKTDQADSEESPEPASGGRRR